MAKFGYKLMAECHGPRDMVRNARRAEAAGFDFVAISDHYHPWLEDQGHSPFTWSVLGAIAEATSTVGIATGLTCPIIRYHPAIVAQAAATVAVMSEGRFTLAVGAGERLNEHVVGQGWPRLDIRHEMLGEAIDIMRMLWSGGEHSFSGAHYEVDDARLYDLPDKPVQIVMGVSGPKSLALAAEKADGIMATDPERELVAGWNKAKKRGPRYGETSLAYAPTKKEGIDLAHKYHRFGAFGWNVLTELPDVASFENATKTVTKDSVAGHAKAGPDVALHVEAVKPFIDAGFDHIALTGMGPDQERFIDFFEKELGPELRKL